jgi:hypothetical protein
MSIFYLKVSKVIPATIIPCNTVVLCPETMPNDHSKTMPNDLSVMGHKGQALRNVIHDVSRPGGRVADSIDKVNGALSMSWSNYTGVPVAKVTECVDVWETELELDIDKEFVLSGIKEGFSIVDLDVSNESTFCRNYKSTLCENRQEDYWMKLLLVIMLCLPRQY